jgi:pimeloyl-ACP methyl ester carboxylesterase
MFSYRKKWLRKIIILAAVVIITPHLISGCFSFRMSPGEVERYYSDQDIQPVVRKIKSGGRNINFATIGSDSLPMVIFIHGAPGSWSAFRHFLKDADLYSKAQLVAVDRPGYGYSDFGVPETRVAEQSKLLSALFHHNKSGKPAILVGHSLGGPIAAQMSINYPKEVGGLILVSPSIDPNLEPEEWYRFPLALPFIRWILPASLDMTNREILHLKKELEKMLPLWEEITSPTTVIQGSKDNLVAPENAKFAKKMIVNAPLKIHFETEADHFIPWNNPGLIKSAILSYLHEDENP